MGGVIGIGTEGKTRIWNSSFKVGGVKEKVLLVATTHNLQFGGYTLSWTRGSTTRDPTNFAPSGKCGGNYAIIALRPTIVAENGECLNGLSV